MMETWIPRDSEDFLKKMALQRPAVVITGARQTGKTSLAKRLFPNHGYVTLDLPSEAEQAEGDPASFLRRHPAPVVIDEVQYAPGLFRHLKSVIDGDRSSNGRFILTGSQKFALMRGASESLAGRAAIVELDGFSLAELRAAGFDSPEHVMVRGSMPELWEKPGLDGPAYYQSYVTTYLERDLRALLDVGSLRDFERFLRACAIRSAQMLNKAELARDVGISPSTAGAWLSVLEASNQIFLLEPWFANKTKTLVKSPKLYLCDSGLLCYLMGIRSSGELLDSPYRGAVWETFVCGELRKKTKSGERGELYYWRDRTKEADFLIHKAGRFEILDAKWNEHPEMRDATVLERIIGEMPEGTVKRAALICRTRNAYPLRKRVEAVPVSEA